MSNWLVKEKKTRNDLRQRVKSAIFMRIRLKIDAKSKTASNKKLESSFP